MSNPLSAKPDKPLAAGFAESCVAWPQRPALSIGGEFFTYAQLLEKTEIVFAQLSSKAVPQYIGIYTSESVWTYAAVLAISLSGACYVPLNAKLPAKKLQEIMTECGMQLVISEKKLPFAHAAQELVLDTKSTTRQKCLPLIEQEMAYLLFTSGTTGDPKGAPVSKSNAAFFFEHYRRHYDFNENDKFLQPYELSFDVSVFSIFAAWNVGACVYCVPDEGIKYLNIVKAIRERGITVSSMVPTVLLYLEKYLYEFSFPQLRYSFFSGDKLYHRLALKWQQAAPNAAIHNCYGPTETTIVCTWYAWNEKSALEASVNGIVPLGKPFEGMEFLLRDEQGTVLHEGTGELCFSGGQVIASYLHCRHEEKFFTHAGKRYYKTGDLAEVNGQQDLVFHGRLDAQVKINGYRVELGEVEHALSQLTGKHVLVLPVEEQQVNRLVAFIETDEVDELQLKNKLSKILPDYMIPGQYLAVVSFPRNINGKIDRRQLKASITG